MRVPAFNIPLKLAISVIIVVFLLSRMDLSAIGAQFAQVEGIGMIWAGIFIFLQIALLAWRWADLINIDSRNPLISYGQSLKITLSSLLANVLFITSISGVVVRIGLTFHYGVTMTKSICAAIADRLMTLAALIILAALFVPFFDRFVSKALHNSAYATMVMLVFTFMIFIPLFFNESVKDMIRSNSKLNSGLDYLLSLGANRTTFLRIVINSLSAQIFYFISVYFVALSSGVSFSFFDLMSVLPVITLVASLPVSFGGWGVREGAFVYGLGLIGVSMETAFIISIQIGLLTMIATVLAGIPALLSMDLRKIGHDVRVTLNKDKSSGQA